MSEIAKLHPIAQAIFFGAIGGALVVFIWKMR